jgi:hypothetical protein
MISDPRLAPEESEETQVQEIAPIYNHAFYDDVIKQEEEWDNWGTVERTDPPYKRIHGSWAKIPSVPELAKRINLKEGTKILNPFNKLLRQYNANEGEVNRMNILLEQASMFYRMPFDYNWRKAILDDEQEHFWHHDLLVVSETMDPIVKTVIKTGNKINDITVTMESNDAG